MRIRRLLLSSTTGLAIVLGCAGAQAATLSLVTDAISYLPGETVTIDVVGDSEGEVTIGLFAAFTYDPAGLVDPAGTRFVPLQDVPNNPPWVNGSVSQGACELGEIGVGPDTCVGLNLINGSPLTPSGVASPEPFVYATITGTAGAPGVYGLDWVLGPQSAELAFFSLGPSNPPASGTLIITPEPGTAALLALGLAGLGGGRRAAAQPG